MRPVLLSILAATVATGCAGGSRRPGDEQLFGPADERGRAIKVSYLRYVLKEDLVTRQRGLMHEYYLIFSQGWWRKRGRRDDRILRVFSDPYEGSEQIPDEELAGLVRRLFDSGLGELRETPPDMINLETLKRIERSQDRRAAARARILTVETDTFSKTVTYDANDDSTPQGPGPLLRNFLAVEREFLLFAALYTVRVTRETLEAVPK